MWHLRDSNLKAYYAESVLCSSKDLQINFSQYHTMSLSMHHNPALKNQGGETLKRGKIKVILFGWLPTIHLIQVKAAAGHLPHNQQIPQSLQNSQHLCSKSNWCLLGRGQYSCHSKSEHKTGPYLSGETTQRATKNSHRQCVVISENNIEKTQTVLSLIWPLKCWRDFPEFGLLPHETG